MSMYGAQPLNRVLRPAVLVAAAMIVVPAAHAERSRSDVKPAPSAPRAPSAPSAPRTSSPAPKASPAPPAVRGGSRGDSGGRTAVRRGEGETSPNRHRQRPDGGDVRRDHRRGGGYYPHYPYYDPFYSGYWGSPYYGFWGWRGWWGLGWYGGAPYGSGYGPGYGRAPSRAGSGAGAIDFDVWPEEAEVWVDGERMGIADELDGFPTYLWLPPGTYDVVVYHSGYRTIARQVSLHHGEIVDVDDEMEEGEAVLPQDLATTSTLRRDTRLERTGSDSMRSSGTAGGRSPGGVRRLATTTGAIADAAGRPAMTVTSRSSRAASRARTSRTVSCLRTPDRRASVRAGCGCGSSRRTPPSTSTAPSSARPRSWRAAGSSWPPASTRSRSCGRGTRPRQRASTSMPARKSSCVWISTATR